MRNNIKLSRSLSLLLNGYGRSILTRTVTKYLGNFAGGHDYELILDQQLPFYGLPSIWPTKRYSYVGLAGLRINMSGKHYISLAGNCLIHSNSFSLLNSYETIWGGGFTYAYQSPVGPLEFTIGYSDYFQKPSISGNIGFWF